MKYPSASSLNAATKNAYSYELIISKEGEILKTMNWELLQYTVLDFINIFLNQGCLFESDDLLGNIGNSMGNQVVPKSGRSPANKVNKQTTEYLRRYAEFFTDFCIQEESFLFVNQMYLACAIIGFARKYTKL